MALAASSARLFSAAWAPIASDTMPKRATARAIERREMRSCVTFIRVSFLIKINRRANSVAPTSFRLCGDAGMVCHPIAINLRHRNKEALACKGISGNLIDILRLNFRQFAQSEEYFTTYSGYDLPLQTASKTHRGSVTSLTFVFPAYLCTF